MKIYLDHKEYKEKPNHKEIIYINKRILNNQVDIGIEQLAKEIGRGKTFIPASFKNIDGTVKRQIKHWESQQIICLDFDNGMKLDEAIKEFKNNAVFIYTTFSHNENNHKFRVVFLLDKCINNYHELQVIYNYLYNKYPMCDTSCRDGSRIFFGGKDIIELNYNNRLIIKDIINYKEYNEGDLGVNNSCKIFYCSHQKPHTTSYDHLDLIRTKNIEALRNIIKPKPIIFYTYTEVYHYLNQQDLSLFLGVNKKPFHCLFHDDTNPSANIFYGDEANAEIYKCFSERCTFKTGTIRKCVERILNCNKVESLKFLMDVYNITLSETDWQRKQKEIIDENIRYIQSVQFQYDYPELYNRIKNYISDLILLHNIAKDNLPAEHYSDEQIEFLFYTSMRHLANIKGVKSQSKIANIVALFVYLGLIFRKNKDELPDNFIDQVIKTINPKHIDIISFFAVPSYCDKIMTFGEEKAIEFKEKHLTMKGWSRELLLRTLGENEANRVYPSQKGKKLSELSHNNVSTIERVLLNFIYEKGWVTEKELYEHVHLNIKSNEYKKKQIKKMIGETLDKYGLKRVRLNRDIKEKYQIDVNGYPFIIIKE
jgi:hypothetical protein